MADREDFATEVGELIKGRSPAGHTHARIESGTGRVLIDASGGVQHWNGDARRWWVDGTGELVAGSVPWDRVTGAVGMPGHMAVWGSSTAEGITPELAAAHKRFGVAVHGKGSFGEWSGQTLFRIVPTTVTVEGGSIPATGTVRIAATVLNGEARQFLPTMGYLAGIYGQVRGYGYPGATGGNFYIFERAKPGDAVTAATAQWVPENPEPAQMNVWLGGGKNDINSDGRTDAQYNTMISNRDAAVAYWQAQGSDALVVSGFINYGTPTGSRARMLLDQEAADAEAKYPGQYLNIQDLLTGDDVWDWTGITPTTDDLAAQAARTLSPSLTGTGNHFNDAGDAYVAHKIAEWLINAGRIGAGSIPFAGPPVAAASRVQSIEDQLATALYESGPRRLTTLLNGWTGDVRIQRVGRDVHLVLSGVSAANATTDVLAALPPGFTPDGKMATPRGLVHTANPSGQAITYRFAITGGNVTITGPRGTTGSALYSAPLVYRTVDPAPESPPWDAA